MESIAVLKYFRNGGLLKKRTILRYGTKIEETASKRRASASKHGTGRAEDVRPLRIQ